MQVVTKPQILLEPSIRHSIILTAGIHYVTHKRRIISILCEFNSLAPGWFEWNFDKSVLKLILVTAALGIFCETTLRWMSLDLTDDKSILVQVMAWCHQATSHYLSQRWPRSLTPYDVTRPQWLKDVFFYHCKYHIVCNVLHNSQCLNNPCLCE